MSKKLPILVESSSPINIKDQIAGQIQSLIASDELKSGDTLPTVIELAEQLSVNHNTVAAVYKSLIKSGYLKSQRGKGTFVTNNEIVKKNRSRQHVYTLLNKAYNLANQFGLSRTEFSLAADSQAAFSSHIANTSHIANNIKVVFMATTAQYERDIYEAITKEIEIPLEFLPWSENEAENRQTLSELKVADLIVTTPLLFPDVVKSMAFNIEVCNIGAEPEENAWQEISSSLNHEMLLLVAENKAESEAMKELLERHISNISNIQVALKAIDEKELEQNDQILNQAKLVFVSQRVENYVRNYVRQQQDDFYSHGQAKRLSKAEPENKVMVLNFRPKANGISLLINRVVLKM